MPLKTEITRKDILDMVAYEGIRSGRRAELANIKKIRRLALGPHASFFFECYETMWYQIHEMLRIEKGGEEQIVGEIEAYNPLIPKGKELVATVMFEIPNSEERARILSGLGGVEKTITMEIGEDIIQATAEEDVDRTSAGGKASSVHFIHFNLSSRQINTFKGNDCRVIVGIGHANYGHMATMPKHMREELSKDFL